MMYVCLHKRAIMQLGSHPPLKKKNPQSPPPPSDLFFLQNLLFSSLEEQCGYINTVDTIMARCSISTPTFTYIYTISMVCGSEMNKEMFCLELFCFFFFFSPHVLVAHSGRKKERKNIYVMF